jgi:hypothetical protein
MKPLAIAIAAALIGAPALVLGTVQAQEMCANQYGACMTRCSSMPPEQAELQSRCFITCQNTNDACAAKLYGNWRATFNAPLKPGDDALARGAAPVREAPRR